MKNCPRDNYSKYLSPYRYQTVTLIFEIRTRDIRIFSLSFLILSLLAESSEKHIFHNTTEINLITNFHSRDAKLMSRATPECSRSMRRECRVLTSGLVHRDILRTKQLAARFQGEITQLFRCGEINQPPRRARANEMAREC